MNSILAVTTLFIILITSNVFSQETPEEAYKRIRALRKEQGKPEEAVQQALIYLQTYMEKNMVRQKIHYEYAAALFQQKKFDDAKTAFATLINDYAETTLDKDSADFMVDDAQYFAAMIEQTQGEKDLDKAIAAYKVVVEKFPKSNWRPNAMITIGNISKEKEKWEDAIAYYNLLVKEYPNSSLAADSLFWTNRILIDHIDNAKRKFVDERVDDEEMVIKQDQIKANIDIVLKKYPTSDKVPEMMKDYIVYLVWRAVPENRDELLETCSYLMEKYPNTSYADYAKEEFIDASMLWGKNEDLKILSNLLDESISDCLDKQNPEKTTSWMLLKGKLLVKEKKYGEARDLMKEALEIMPNTPIKFEIQLTSAMTFVYERKYPESREVFKQILEEFSDDKQKCAVIEFHNAMTYSNEKDYTQALNCFYKILADYPDSTVSKAAEEQAEYCIRILDQKKKESGLNK